MRRLALALSLLWAAPTPAADPPTVPPFVVILDGRAYLAMLTLRPLDASALASPPAAEKPDAAPTGPKPGPKEPILKPVPLPDETEGVRFDGCGWARPSQEVEL